MTKTTVLTEAERRTRWDMLSLH